MKTYNIIAFIKLFGKNYTTMISTTVTGDLDTIKREATPKMVENFKEDWKGSPVPPIKSIVIDIKETRKEE